MWTWQRQQQHHEESSRLVPWAGGALRRDLGRELGHEEHLKEDCHDEDDLNLRHHRIVLAASPKAIGKAYFWDLGAGVAAPHKLDNDKAWWWLKHEATQCYGSATIN